uniref:Uncharacterized protein n=1 Tax=Arundo donax TaxID=35708 RepID=A0A0A9G5G3_ARUDO
MLRSTGWNEDDDHGEEEQVREWLKNKRTGASSRNWKDDRQGSVLLQWWVEI